MRRVHEQRHYFHTKDEKGTDKCWILEHKWIVDEAKNHGRICGDAREANGNEL